LGDRRDLLEEFSRGIPTDRLVLMELLGMGSCHWQSTGKEGLALQRPSSRLPPGGKRRAG